MKIAIASDHAGFKYKELIKDYLLKSGYEVKDYGTNSTESVDYPDFIKKAAKDVSEGKADLGIGCCGSGIGVSIVANKFKGVRAAQICNVEMAALSKQHNDSNFLALGERFLKTEEIIPILNVWLTTKFEGGRHKRRVDKVNKL